MGGVVHALRRRPETLFAMGLTSFRRRSGSNFSNLMIGSSRISTFPRY